MLKHRLPQLIQRLALLCLLVFAGFAAASGTEACAAASPCSSCTLFSECQASLSASANGCCTLGAASLLPAAVPLHIGPGAASDLAASPAVPLMGRSFAPPLPPPRTL